ncbi:MAG: GntR family transcriptional regulator [Acidiphilium sp.]
MTRAVADGISMDAPPESEPEPIRRWTLHDELVSRIRDMIIEGRMAPGQRVHEGLLGKTLGVSRTPLREALKFLASEGLVELVAGRGAVIREFSQTDVHDMLEVLGEIEALGGRLACARASDTELAHMRALHDEMMRLYAAADQLGYYKCNQAIHSGLALLSGNAFLAATHDTIQSRLKRVRFIGHDKPAHWSSAVAEHDEIMTALENRDAERLSAAIKHHLHQAWLRAREVM